MNREAPAKIELREVDSGESEIRLDRWFKRHFPNLTHGRLEKLLRTGQIRVDGKRVEAGERLNAGQMIRVPPLDFSAEQAPRPKQRQVIDLDRHAIRDLQSLVLYRDADVLVINKPAGLAVQGGTGTKEHLDGMLDALKFDAEERPRLVHRLDRDTSGVLLLARTAAAARRLGASFQSRDTEKLYWAVVVGHPSPHEGRIDQPLGKAGGWGHERVAVAEGTKGDRAVTLYEVLGFAARRAAMVAFRPITGRTHQIRVHATLLGTPILGDAKYGGMDAFLPGADLAPQLHLHARRLTLPHPRKGTIDVTAPVPAHIDRTLKYLGLGAD